MLERKIISQFIHNEEFCRKVAPYIKPEYFSDKYDKVMVEMCLNFFATYNQTPSKDILEIDVKNVPGLSDQDIPKIQSIIRDMEPSDDSIEWLVDSAEKFCKDKAIFNAVLKSIGIS